jgi:uncharacterized protein (DUF433 family)
MPSKIPWPETTDICDHGNGPAIRNTRLVMTDIYQMLYGRTHRSAEEVAAFYRLPVEKIRAAIAYIDSNRGRVEADMQVIRERAACGNPPEVQAKLDAAHQRFLLRLNEHQRQRVRELFGEEGENGQERPGV